LSEEKQKQVIALGQLGWTLRRIEKETGVRRETAAGYLRSAGIAVRPRGRWGRAPASKTGHRGDHRLGCGRQAKSGQRSRGDHRLGAAPPPRSPSASACLPFHELIEAGLAKRRNAMAIWQELVDRSGFTGAYQSVKRYVRKLRGARIPEPCAVILTAVGEEAQVDYGCLLQRPTALDRPPHPGAVEFAMGSAAVSHKRTAPARVYP
jgi:hypothetical protein